MLCCMQRRDKIVYFDGSNDKHVTVNFLAKNRTMIRRNFIKGFSILTTKDLLISALHPLSKEDTRAYWVQTLTRIVIACFRRSES